MIAHFDDFCLWVYVLVDDMYKELEVPAVATVN